MLREWYLGEIVPTGFLPVPPEDTVSRLECKWIRLQIPGCWYGASMRVLVIMTTLLLAPLLVAAQTPAQPSAAEQALMEAAYLGNLDTVQRLVKEGVAADFTDSERRTPLMVAAFNGHTPVLRYLLEEGAALDAKDVNGRTALMYASSGPFAEAVGLLLEKGADVNLQGTLEGFTALMTAASEGLVEVVQLLLDHGADPGLQDKDGDTAISFAQQNGHAEVVRMLANPSTSDD